MAAYDNAPMPSAPGAMSYGAGLVDFSPIGQLADSYFKGQQQQRTEKVANAFKDGLPTDDKGQPDYNAMAAKLFQLGDYGGGASLATTGYKLKALQDTGDATPPVFGQQGAPGAASQPHAPVAPAPQAPGQSFAAPAPTAAVSGGSPTGYNGGDNGQNTVASVVMAKMPPEIAGPAINRIAGRLGIDPNAPLNQDQMAKVGLGLLNEGVGTATGGHTPGAPPTPQPTQVAQAQPDAAPTQPSPAAALVPEQYRGREREFSDTLRGLADKFRQQARREGVAGIPSKALEDRAAAYDARAAKIDEALAPTEAQRNATASGTANPLEFEAEKEQRKIVAERGNSLYRGLQGASRAADEMRPHLQAMEAIFKDPNFTSGTGEGLQLALKRVQAAIPSWMGGDPNAALPNEALRKVLAQNVLNSTDQLKAEGTEMGSAGGRIFQQQIQLMMDAAQKPENTPAALRYLTELGTRAADHANAVARLAAQYKGGRLDPEFDLKLQDYNRQHPMFTPAEMADIRLVAPPVAPKLDSPEAAAAWARKAGIDPGSPIKLPSGRIVPAP